jgi:hypothetical protein
MSWVILMKKNINKYPFANEVKEMKDNFKRMIDSMSDDEFLDFIEYINACTEIYNDDYDEELWSGDEGWEDEAAKFYGYDPDEIQDDDTLPF